MTQKELFLGDMKEENRQTWLHHQSYPGSIHGMVFVCHLHCHESGDLKSYEDAKYKGEFELNDNYRRHWCGYVGVPQGHEYYGVGYMDDYYSIHDIEAYTHGGITYTNKFEEWGDKFWFIGFDCSHCQDLTKWSEVQDETCHSEGKGSFKMNRSYKTKEYAKNQVNGMLKELVNRFHNNMEDK